MGLFDSLAKQALGGIMGGNQQGDMLSGLLNQAGGLDGLKDRFQQVGLGEVFASWVSTGANQPVQPSQLEGALGSDAIQNLASKVGFDVKNLLPLLSQFLPQVIDQLTPNGSIDETHPSSEKLQSVLSSVMKSGLGSFFGGRA
jgi:uncharacterized protein YidB (DUF937 family)